MKKNRAVVTVHGREYTLLGEEPSDYMLRVAAYVDRRMSEISFSAPLSEERLMALTALNLADELLKSKDEVSAMRKEMTNMRKEMAALRKKTPGGETDEKAK
ncbi:MAG: cell division protein ZapA [Candidatus Spyradocola sp.]|jgi:cell division protein ZapA